MRSDDEIRADLATATSPTQDDDAAYLTWHDAVTALLDDVPSLLADRERYRGMLAHIEAENAQLVEASKAANAALWEIHDALGGMWRQPNGTHDVEWASTTDTLTTARGVMAERDNLRANAVGALAQRERALAERDEARAALAAVRAVVGEHPASALAPALRAALAAAGVPEPPQEPQPEQHKPYNDDGALYCGYWAGAHGIIDGCGQAWPCPTVKMRDAALPVGERITDGNGDELEHGTDSDTT